MVPEPTAENISNNESVPIVDESRQGMGASVRQTQSVPMQSEHNSVLRDVEAVREESSKSEATLGESLRSVDVEIGSADGHDDSAKRQGPVDSRTRTNASLGIMASVSGIEASLHSVTEVSESPSQEAEEGDAAQDTQHDSGSGSAQINPAFLDALLEELRAEVLFGRQGSVTQPSNAEP